MSRTFLLVSGAVCWAVAGADALVHLVSGDLLVPAAMTAVFVLWVGLRWRMLSLRRRAEPVEFKSAA
jgi:hypothetical protein